MASEAASRPAEPEQRAADTPSAQRSAGRSIEQALMRAGSIALTPVSKLIRLWRRSIGYASGPPSISKERMSCS